MNLFETLTIDRAQFEAERDRLVREVLTAAKGTITDATKKLERDLEAATRAAVPGRLWRAWASQVYPSGTRLAREPVGEIFVKGGARSSGAMTFFTKPGRIKSKDGFFLAIPTPAAGSRGRDRHLTPGEWERAHGAKLRFVYRKGRPSLLVLDEGVLSVKRQVARLNTERRRAKGRGNTTIVIFVLLPMVAFANRFSVEPIVSRAASRLLSNFQRRLGPSRGW